MSAQKKKVYVAMSGGVDSSVAALLLRGKGYEVAGVFMQGWQNPRFECTWREDRQDAARVAAILNIPFRTIDFSREYHDKVVSYMVEEYRQGRTPNPDVMCNKEIKFGLFFDWAMSSGADYIATGHYVRKESDDSGKVFAGRDAGKDQSYFLWTLSPEIARASLFPIGEYQKSEVRALAREAGLPTASKKDSQGICFVGKGSVGDFLKDHIESRRGSVVTATGEHVGDHDGIEYFTIGQRHGIGTPGGRAPYYVVAKEPSTQTLVVAEENDPMLYKNELRFAHPSWMVTRPFPIHCKARIRYRAVLAECDVFEDGRVIFAKPQRAVAPGQSIVFYDGELLLGGAVIEQ